MEQDKFFLDRKYVKFIKNIKLSLNKAISSGNMELVDIINEYLDTIEKLKKLYVLKEKNDVKTYSVDSRMYRKKLEDLQKKILYIQYNNPSSTFTNNNLVIDVPKFKNDDINYIFMFIYKFIKINNKSICIILKNFIDDLFNLNITDINFTQICSSKILDNITIVYDNRLKKIKYIYRPIPIPSTSTDYTASKKILNTLVDKINDFDINTVFNKKETKELNKLVESNDNIIDDSNNIIYEKPPSNILISENVDLSFNKKSDKELKITLAILLINILKNIHCDTTNKLSKNELKSQICKYLTLNPKFNIEKEYNLLYNYFLTRNLDTVDVETKKMESNINIVIPEFSLSLVNNIVILFYIYIKDNKDDICKNILIFLKNLKNELVKKTYSSFDDGSYFNSINKILSVCSNSSRAEHLINTFYLKYKEYDKILISNLLLKIIENDSLKIKYDVVEDKFSVVIINQKTLNIDFKQIDKTKLLEGLNNDLKCINESINKDLIIKLIDFIRESLNNIISIVSDVEILTSIFNLSTDSIRIYGYLKNTKTNFKIRKLLVILLIKFLVIHISKFYLDPNNSKFNMYDSLVNDLYKHICEKLTVDFSYNIYRKMEHLYKDFPNYEIN
jgi:hypothetical protein